MTISPINTQKLENINLKNTDNTIKIKNAEAVSNSIFDNFEADTQTANYSDLTSNYNEGNSNLRAELEKTRDEQGLIGKAWDGIKNLFGFGAGSNKAEKAIEQYENGEISYEEAQKALTDYQMGQENCVDIVADIASGIASFGAFSLATGIGLVAAPFTGGASLGLVAAGFAVAGVAGGASKVAVKGLDAAVGGREYDSLGYDLATGSINGIFAPITAGVGGAAGKAVASRVGVQFAKEGGEVVVKEAIEGTIKGSITKAVLNTNIRYTGGTLAARALAMGTDMAVNGAISGAVDSGVRYLASDEENKSLAGFAQEVAVGTVGGFVASPIIGGGMRLVGNKMGSLTGKLQNEVSTSYSNAKSSLMNVVSTDSPDIEIAKEFGDIYKQAANLVDGVKVQGVNFLDAISDEAFEYSGNINSLLDEFSSIIGDYTSASAENKALVSQILEKIANNEDANELIAQLAKKSLDVSGALDDKIAAFAQHLDDGISMASTYNDAVSQKVQNAFEFGKQAVNTAGDMAQQGIEAAKKIPETSAYKQLGNLPERVKTGIADLYEQVGSIDEIVRKIQTEATSGSVDDLADDLTKYYDELDLFGAQLEKQMSGIKTTLADSGIDESADIVKGRLSKLMATPEFQNMTREEQIQAVVENSNILLSKFAQTFSSDDSIPDELSTILKQFTSNCTTSRTTKEAQTLADELYGQGKYTIKKSFGAGTIGETYLAATEDGKDVVIKMLKDGVTPERFAEDRSLFVKYIEEFIADPKEKEYKLNLINSMFDAWDRELNFALEAQGAKNLADSATRFNVAQTLEVGTKNGQNISLVMEKANGVRLDTLLEMVELYKENPSEYLIKYADDIEKFPALKNPDSWMGKLGEAYQLAQNEQVMFVNKSGVRTIHADPHSGNIFVDFDSATSQPIINYIDTGNIVQRTSSQTLDDITLSMNMMIGNSKGIAESLMQGATLPSNVSREELTEQFAKMLDERLYKAGVNLKSTKYTQNTINGIMKELNIIPDSGNSNLMKATLQRIETSRAINRACGTSSNKKIDISDLMTGVMKSFKTNPKETMQKILPILKWAFKNREDAMSSFFQMVIS